MPYLLYTKSRSIQSCEVPLPLSISENPWWERIIQKRNREYTGNGWYLAKPHHWKQIAILAQLWFPHQHRWRHCISQDWEECSRRHLRQSDLRNDQGFLSQAADPPCPWKIHCLQSSWQPSSPVLALWLSIMLDRFNIMRRKIHLPLASTASPGNWYVQSEKSGNTNSEACWVPREVFPANWTVMATWGTSQDFAVTRAIMLKR